MKLADIFTEGDNATVCPVRVGMLSTAVIYHVGALAGVIGQHLALDMATLGFYVQHMSTLFGIGALGVGAKSVLKADADGPPQ